MTLLVLQGWLSCQTHGIKTAVLPYATLPYGNNIYHLAVTIAECTKPFGCLFYHRYTLKSPLAIIIGGGFCTLLIGYIVAMASLSPCPILMDSAGGGALVVGISFPF